MASFVTYLNDVYDWYAPRNIRKAIIEAYLEIDDEPIDVIKNMSEILTNFSYVIVNQLWSASNKPKRRITLEFELDLFK